MVSPNEKPILEGLNLQDIASIRRFIFCLQKSLNHLPDINHREGHNNPPTKVEKREVRRCHDLMVSNPLLTAIVNRFLENWQQDDMCVLASADWLKRTATEDTFVMGSKAYEKVRRAWIEAIENGDTWTYQLPELKLSGPAVDDNEDKETGEDVGVEKESEMQPPGLPSVEGVEDKDISKDKHGMKQTKNRKFLAKFPEIPETGEGDPNLEVRLEKPILDLDFHSKPRDPNEGQGASEDGINPVSNHLSERPGGVTKTVKPRPNHPTGKRAVAHKKTTPKSAPRKNVGRKGKKGQKADGGDEDDEDGNVSQPPAKEETPAYQKGPQVERILAKGWHVAANSLSGVPEWCYFVKWKNSMASEWETAGNIRRQFGFEVNLFEATMQVLNPNGPPSW